MIVVLDAKDKVALIQRLKAIKIRLTFLQELVALHSSSLELLKANQVAIQELFLINRELRSLFVRRSLESLLTLDVKDKNNRQPLIHGILRAIH